MEKLKQKLEKSDKKEVKRSKMKWNKNFSAPAPTTITW